MATRSEKTQTSVSDGTAAVSVVVPPTSLEATGASNAAPIKVSGVTEGTSPSGTDPHDIPGANLVGRGVYIKPRQPYELKPFIFESGQGRLQLYTSPETKITYQVPENCIVNDTPPMSSDQSLGETVIEESWDRFGSALALNASAAAGNGLISIDPTGVRISDLRSGEDSYYALRSSFIAFWNLSMVSIPTAPALCEEVKLLPLDPLNPSNRAAYARIFEKYGSHFVKSTWVGGKASLAFVVAKSSQLTKEEIRVGIQASLGGMLKTDISASQKTISEKFRSSSTCKVFGSGGNRIELAKLTSLDPQTYENWIESVKDNPQPIQFGLAGIWTLLDDPEKASALKTAYIQESSFTPLRAVIPATASAGAGSLYFLKDEGVFEYRLFAKPGEPKTTRHPEFLDELKRKFAQPKLAKFVRPDAAISLDGFGGALEGALYLFRHGECLRIDFSKSPIVSGDYPKEIVADWPGVDFDRIDAALTVAPDKIYFFRGSSYIRIDVAKGKTPVVGTRDVIKNRWMGVTFDRIDTAFYWGNSKVYLFSGDQYIRYDMALFRADPAYPKFLQSNYPEDWEIFE